MSVLSKKIVLCVTGGIAVYKAPELVRRLIDHGADVQVVMTAAACEFVKPLVFQAVSGNEVHTELLDDKAEAGMGHIELARWADIVLIAPCTANTLAKLTAGLADDLLSTLCLATRAPLVVAPAMNSVMWEAAATIANMQICILAIVAAASHMTEFIAGATTSGARVARQSVDNKSSARPAVSFANVFAVQGAIRTMSAQRASSI